jgi:hypothetical protein
LGIVVTLLFGLFGQQALALCVSGNHRAIEVMGHAPCGPALPSDGEALASGPRCDDTALGGTLEAILQQDKRDATQAALMPIGGGTAALPASAAMPQTPPTAKPPRAVAVHLDLHLHSRRTVVLLI